HGLNREAVGEARYPRRCAPGTKQLGRLVDERLAVADTLADRPGVRRVGMTGMLRPDTAEPVELRIVAAVTELELIQARVVEDQGATRAVHLDPEVARPAHGQPGHLDGSAGAALKAKQGSRRIVDRHGLLAIRRAPRPDGRRRLGH